MLDEKDFTQIGALMKQNNDVLRKEMKDGFTENNQVLRKEMRENTEALRQEMKENNAALVKEVVVQVGEVLEQQVLPQISTLETRFDSLEAKVINLPDKSYLDDKLADLKGDFVAKLRAEDEKVNFIVDLHQQRGVLTEQDVLRIKQEFQIFPNQSV